MVEEEKQKVEDIPKEAEIRKKRKHNVVEEAKQKANEEVLKKETHFEEKDSV